MLPLCFLAAVLLELAQGVQDKSSLRVVGALGEVSAQSVAPKRQPGSDVKENHADETPEDHEYMPPEQEAEEVTEVLRPTTTPAPVVVHEEQEISTTDHVPDQAEEVVKKMIEESYPEAPVTMTPVPTRTEEKEPVHHITPGTSLAPVQEQENTPQEMTPEEQERTIEATLDDDEDGVEINEHTGVPQTPEFREHEMQHRTEYAKLPSAKVKLLYLHNAFRCVHGASQVEWDDSLEFDMKSAMTKWTIEQGTAGLPHKSGVVANLFWNSGQAAPTPEESVGSWYEQCDNCTGGCSGFTDGCPSRTSAPTSQFRNIVRTDVKKIACVNSMDAKSLVCFYSADPSNATSQVTRSHRRAKLCDATAALTFTKKLLCMSSYHRNIDDKELVTLHMTRCLGGASQSLILRRGTLEFKDPAGKCMTVGERGTGDDDCHLVTLTKCDALDKLQQWRFTEAHVYFNKSKEQQRWKNPETNTTLRIRNRQIWSCVESSKTPFLRLGR